MAHSLIVLGGQLLGMILIVSGTVLGLHGSIDSEPWVGPFLGIGEAVAGIVLFGLGVTALVVATPRGSPPVRRISRSQPSSQWPAMAEAAAVEPRETAQEISSGQVSAAGFEALIRWDEQVHEKTSSGSPPQTEVLPSGVERSGQTPKYSFSDV